jgi:hypothetical protein
MRILAGVFVSILLTACGDSNNNGTPTSVADDADGPTACFCAQAMVTDPETAAACEEALVEYDTPQKVVALTLECAKQ